MLVVRLKVQLHLSKELRLLLLLLLLLLAHLVAGRLLRQSGRLTHCH